MAIRLLTLDLCARLLRVEGTDGSVAVASMPDDMGPADTNIRRMTMDLAGWELTLRLPNGTDAVAEMPRPMQDDTALLAGRQVIYLDQNHWSSLARWQADPSNLSRAEAQAAETLVAGVEAKRLVLPFSAGHMAETMRLYGDRRTTLASTVLALSRGWHMRDPIDVGIRELALSLDGHPPVAEKVFTLDTGAIVPQDADAVAKQATDAEARGLPPDVAWLSPRLGAATGLYDAMVDPEQIDQTAGRAAADAWARPHEDLAVELGRIGAAPSATREVAFAWLLNDLKHDLVEVARASGHPMTTATRWIDELAGLTDAMPYLGRVRELLFHRLRNTNDRWVGNDLIDIPFLCCAAGYADIVVGENKTIGYLRQAKRTTANAALTTTIAEAVECLECAASSTA